MKKLLKLALSTFAAVAALSSAHAQNVFLNEFHYDNAGADAGEFVEFAIASSLDVSNVTVELVNGSDGAVYATHTGSEFTLGSTVNGISFYALAIPGIQNGAPDGIAIGFNGSLVAGQFLSYEGAFTATSGLANGFLSMDIGISEAGTEPVGGSLGLVGSGRNFSDFTFAANSQGALNAGQMITAVPEPTVYMLLGFGILLCGQRFLRRRAA